MTAAPREDEKRGLERILSVGLFANQSPANTKNHRSVPGDERRKRVLIVLVREPIEQRRALKPRGGPSSVKTGFARVPDRPRHGNPARPVEHIRRESKHQFQRILNIRCLIRRAILGRIATNLCSASKIRRHAIGSNGCVSVLLIGK
jgi:hypothetical protein